MKERVLTAIVGIPLLLLCCYFGGWLLILACWLLAVVGVMELGRLFAGQGWQANTPLDILAVLALVLSLGVSRQALWPFAVVLLVVAVGYAIYAQRQEKPLTHSLAQAFATFYVGAGFGALLALRMYHINWSLILLAFLNVWISDGMAYEVGRRFGRNRLAPTISPNKTWEGALAGLICAVMVCGVYMRLVLHIHYANALGLAVLFSIIAQAGDLLESAFKRWAGVKDAGYIFPGHGGVLDRFDSIMLSAPFILLLLGHL